MPRVECFEVPGLDLRFHSHDHRPAHFHARKPGEWEIRVFFLREPPAFAEEFVVTRISASTLRMLLERAAEHRAELLEEWSRGVGPDG